MLSGDEKHAQDKESIENKFSIESRDSYINETKPISAFRVDLSESDHMDSSALGIILLLNEHAEKLAGNVVIERPSETILKILKIANFDKLFTIE